jgi:arylformamidase
MKIIDITVPISPSMPVWPNNPPVILEQVSSMDRGDHDNVSRLDCGVHTGTHVDAPHHFLNDHRTIESLSLDVLTGPAQVVHLSDEVGVVTAEVLAGAGVEVSTTRLLLRTRNSRHWAQGDTEFDTAFVGISADGAAWLVEHGIRLVGIDYLSVAPYHQSVPTHRTLLEAGMVILEGADLSTVESGIYQLYCLPLKLVGSDGAPARAILIA